MAASETYRLVWSIVRKIPKGRVSTYGRIAAICGMPGRSRLVGYALHALPPGTTVPWQRVINAGGRISFPASSEAYRTQKRLLEKEGVIFKKGRTDLVRFGWPRSPKLERRRLKLSLTP